MLLTERIFKHKQSRAIGAARVAHGKLRRRFRKRIRRMKLAGEGTECNDHCSKNWGHLWVCLVLPMKAIASRKLPTISWLSVTGVLGHELCMFRFMWKWQNKRKRAYERIRQITFLRVSQLLKDWKRMSMPALWREFLGFWFHYPFVFKGGRPDSKNSKLVKAQTVPKVTSRNLWHAAGAHRHRYLQVTKHLNHCNSWTKSVSHQW